MNGARAGTWASTTCFLPKSRPQLADNQRVLAVGKADRAANGAARQVLVPEHEPVAAPVVPVKGVGNIAAPHKRCERGCGFFGNQGQDRAKRGEIGGVRLGMFHRSSPCSGRRWTGRY